jgi:hypothetical protein
VLVREKLKGVTLPIEEPVEYDVAEAGEAEETVRVIATAFSTAEPLAVARAGSDRVICNATHERTLLSPTGSRLWFEDHWGRAFFIVANHSRGRLEPCLVAHNTNEAVA